MRAFESNNGWISLKFEVQIFNLFFSFKLKFVDLDIGLSVMME